MNLSGYLGLRFRKNDFEKKKRLYLNLIVLDNPVKITDVYETQRKCQNETDAGS